MPLSLFRVTTLLQRFQGYAPQFILCFIVATKMSGLRPLSRHLDEFNKDFKVTPFFLNNTHAIAPIKTKKATPFWDGFL